MAEAGPSTRFRSIVLAALAAGGVLLPAALLAVVSFGLLPAASTTPTRDAMATSDQAWAGAYGASGVLPQTAELTPAVLEKIRSGDDIAAGIPDDVLVIPPPALAAYQRAESALALREPGCQLRWTLLAGLGRVLSEHGGGGLDPAGNSFGPIVGPALDGSFGLASIRDTDGGQIDSDTAWDRAAGPLQIIPSTWRRIGVDSDGDGIGSPHNVFDAALAAGYYLCADGADLGELSGQAHAVFRYQQSDVFVRAVMAWTKVYGDRIAPVGSPTMALPPVQDIPPRSATPPPAGPLPSGVPQPPASAPALPAAPPPDRGTPADAPRWPGWPMPTPMTGSPTRPPSTIPPTTETTAPSTTTTGPTTTRPATTRPTATRPTTTTSATVTTTPATTTTTPATT